MHGLRFLFAAVMTAAVLASTAVAAAHPAPASALAPADEYFGRMKMSILGIRNELQLIRGRVESGGRPGDVLASAKFVEDAMRDWARRYPRDPWLIADVRTLTSIYERVDTPFGHRCAMRGEAWLARLENR